MKILISFMFFAFIAGCATPGVNIPRESKIAPLSIVGNDLDFRVVGTTVFQNKSDRIDVSDWKVDDQTEIFAVAAIKNSGLTAVRTSAEARKDIGTLSFFNITSTYSFSGREESLRKAAQDAGADYLLIVAKAPNAFMDPFFHTNQFITGYGIYQRYFMGNRTGVNFVQFAVLLVDGKTGNVIASRVESLSSPRQNVLWVEVDGARSNAANLSYTRGAIATLIEAVINLAWDRMKVTVAP